MQGYTPYKTCENALKTGFVFRLQAKNREISVF